MNERLRLGVSFYLYIDKKFRKSARLHLASTSYNTGLTFKVCILDFMMYFV